MDLTKILQLFLSQEENTLLLAEQLLQQSYPTLAHCIHLTVADLITATNLPSYKNRQVSIEHNQKHWIELTKGYLLPNFTYQEFGQPVELCTWQELLMAIVINYINRVKINGSSIGSHTILNSPFV